MVISLPTYHIVSNILPGRHKLGTIVNNLQDMTPLNKDEEIEIPDDRRFRIEEEDFEATRNQILRGSGGVGLKFLVSQAPIAGDVGGRGESIVDEIYTAKSLKTEWFEPIKEDYKNAVRDGTGLHDYLVEGGPPSVYMITGIKIARQPARKVSRGRQVEGNLQLGIELGIGGIVGPKGDGSKASSVMQKSEKSADVVLAVRVRKLSYKKRHWLFGQKVWSNKPSDKGAELVRIIRDEGVEGLIIDFEADELELDDELEAFMEEDEEGEGTSMTWIVPTTVNW